MNLLTYTNPVRRLELALVLSGDEEPPTTSLEIERPIDRVVAKAAEIVNSNSRMTEKDAKLAPVLHKTLKDVPRRHLTDHLFWHKKATHTKDVESFLPIRRLEAYAAQGRIGNLAPRFYGVPTDYSIRRTVDELASAAFERCRTDEVDAALLVAL